jgi:putative transposase
MFRLLRLLFASIPSLFRSRRDLVLEIIVLRQQLSVLKRKKSRPRFQAWDRLFWLLVSKTWSNWKNSLFLLTPETIVRWHRAGFHLYWSWLCRRTKSPGRKKITKELRKLIFQMAAENPTWGAPRIHGELLKLGFDVSERTVSRWVQRAPKDPERRQRWKAFLLNHREVIAAMDFFTVPTLTFGMLYCFFVIAHDRRRILHCGVSKQPTSHWIAQQLREAFPYEAGHKYLIFDHDKKFGTEVLAGVNAVGLKSVRISFRSPWQNGVAERWIGSCRRDLLDHVIPIGQRHLRRLLSEYVRYYQDDRTHLGLQKDTPAQRRVACRSVRARVISEPRIGGLHHRYDLAA